MATACDMAISRGDELEGVRDGGGHGQWLGAWQSCSREQPPWEGGLIPVRNSAKMLQRVCCRDPEKAEGPAKGFACRLLGAMGRHRGLLIG